MNKCKRMKGRRNKWTKEQMDKREKVQIDEWTREWTKGRKDRWMNG